MNCQNKYIVHTAFDRGKSGLKRFRHFFLKEEMAKRVEGNKKYYLVLQCEYITHYQA